MREFQAEVPPELVARQDLLDGGLEDVVAKASDIASSVLDKILQRWKTSSMGGEASSNELTPPHSTSHLDQIDLRSIEGADLFDIWTLNPLLSDVHVGTQDGHRESPSLGTASGYI
jgi:hypothetical protein